MIKGVKEDIKLKEDVKNFVKTKIKNIKSVNEIFPLFDFKIEKQNIEIDFSEKLSQYKKILQLTLNLYNNYDLYQKYTVKFYNKEVLTPLYNNYDGTWRCDNRPKEEDIVTALYNYIFCYLMVENKENEADNTVEEVNIDKCPFCDGSTFKKKGDCDICNSSSSEIFQYLKKARKEESKQRNINNVKEVEEVNTDYNKEKDKDGKIIDNERSKESQKNKWKCEKCKGFNEHGVDKCIACRASCRDLKWTCEVCMEENNMDVIHCQMCNHVNDNVKHNETLYNKDTFKRDGNACNNNEKSNNKTEMKISRNKWKCGRCECMNEYTFINCEVCEGLYKDGKWNCGKCTMENSCVNNICSECKEDNYNMKTKDKINEEKNEFIKNENDIKEFMIKNKEIEGKTTYNKWNCEKCRLKNSCIDNKCSDCGENNVNIKNERKENDEINDLTKNENYVKEFTINNKEIERKPLNDKWKCGRCECMNEYTFINCKACEGLYKDGKWNCGKCTIENSFIDNKCSDCGENNVNIKNERRENDERNDLTKNENDIKEFMIKNKEIEGKTTYNKWKCGKCEYLNDYIFDHCKACGGLYKDGKWNCGKCRMGNICVDDICRECGEKNVNVEIKNKLNDGELLLLKYQSDKGNEVELDNDQWRCGRCGGFQLYNFTVCNVCSGSRIANGLWKCSQCTMINKCGDKECTVCGVMNYQLLSKYCEYCKKNKVKKSEVRCEECARNQNQTVGWRCGRTHCKKWNINNDDYCHKCQIYCQSSKLRGESVRMYNKESCVWICVECYNYNEENNTKCDCGESRYNKAYCKDCRLLSDGRSKNCDKCHKRLS